MNENQQAETESQRISQYEDEIELIDILRVIWKWKYFIIFGTIAFSIIAATISFKMTKIYAIDMVLRPGILSIEKGGKLVYIDSPQNIKALIDSEAFNNDILNYLNEKKMGKIPMDLYFKVKIPKETNAIKVRYETADIEQGKIIQDRLGKLLLETYSKLVQYYKNEYDIKLEILNSKLDYLKATILSHKRNVTNIEKRIHELVSESGLIKNNTANLIKEKDILLSKDPKENNILSALLYSNTIQQNLQLSNNYQDKINNYNQKKEAELQKSEKSENEIADKLNEIKNLQFKKNNIQNIQFLQTATSSLLPVKPRLKLSVILALVAGFFIFLFFSFFLEYLKRHKIS